MMFDIILLTSCKDEDVLKNFVGLKFIVKP